MKMTSTSAPPKRFLLNTVTVDKVYKVWRYDVRRIMKLYKLGVARNITANVDFADVGLNYCKWRRVYSAPKLGCTLGDVCLCLFWIRFCASRSPRPFQRQTQLKWSCCVARSTK